tara:strand:- start:36 stop:269 length:234 start_codon:yes stop_codon:yes gene_type:complete
MTTTTKASDFVDTFNPKAKSAPMASEKAEQVLFKLQFMSLMMMTGRIDEAEKAFQEAQVILAEVIAETKQLESAYYL